VLPVVVGYDGQVVDVEVVEVDLLQGGAGDAQADDVGLAGVAVGIGKRAGDGDERAG
jgi:hypothetical protein